ncbi:ion transporter [Streptomyces sp. NPDC048172]|uniref:ion transporter n=1 Tax=Streptomyces sp. NPDC048172 TaxID=3365505 RepID=UPI00371E7EB3
MPEPASPVPPLPVRRRRRHRASQLAERCRRVTESGWFGVLAFGLILGNALLLGVETYAEARGRWHDELKAVEHVFLAAFTAEIVLRLAACADRPKAFFRDPWNVFDLGVVLVAYLPFARENATVLRLLRLARVLRAARFLPQLRIVLVAVGKSLPGTLSFLLVGALLLYVYAMAGWVFFAGGDPEHFGSLGRAGLTLFLLMTLDGLGDAVRTGLEISRWSIVYFASYVLLSSFVLVNLLIGVVINSLDEAREADRGDHGDRRGAEYGEHGSRDEVPGADVRARIDAARRALDALEHDLASATIVSPSPPASAGAPCRTCGGR